MRTGDRSPFAAELLLDVEHCSGCPTGVGQAAVREPTVLVTDRRARLLYVAMTRAVQELHFVTDSPAPDVLAVDA